MRSLFVVLALLFPLSAQALGGSTRPMPLGIIQQTVTQPNIALAEVLLTNAYRQQPIQQIIRASDSVTRNIYASNGGVVDWPDELSFVGASGSASVGIWYSQNGGGNATSTNAPQVVIGGALVTLNALPSVNCNGSNGFSTSSVNLTNSTGDWSANTISYSLVTNANQSLISSDDFGSNRLAQFINYGASSTTIDNIAFTASGSAFGVNGTGDYTIANILTSTQTGGVISLFFDGTSQGSSSGSPPMKVAQPGLTSICFALGGGSNVNGNLSLALEMPSLASQSDRQEIEHWEEVKFNIAGQ